MQLFWKSYFCYGTVLLIYKLYTNLSCIIKIQKNNYKQVNACLHRWTAEKAHQANIISVKIEELMDFLLQK